MDRKPAPTPRLDAADRCPRCGGAFHCGANDAAPCACTTLTLTAGLRAQLRARYVGCLCLHCLAALAAQGEAGDAADAVSAAPAAGAC